MSSQLNKYPVEILNSSSNRDKPASSSRTWLTDTALVAVLIFGVGMIVAVGRTDGARSPADRPEQPNVTVFRVSPGVLPAHLVEFEAFMEARSSDGGVLPVHLVEFEAFMEARSSGDGVLPGRGGSVVSWTRNQGGGMAINLASGSDVASILAERGPHDRSSIQALGAFKRRVCSTHSDRGSASGRQACD